MPKDSRHRPALLQRDVVHGACAGSKKGLLSLSITNLEQSVSLCGGPLFLALLKAEPMRCPARGPQALEILDRIKTLSHQTWPVSPFDIAVIQIGVGDLISAFEQLEEAYRQRVFRLIELTMPDVRQPAA